MPKLTFPAELQNLKSMLSFIVSGTKELGFSSKKLSQIQIACEEVLVNIINYAYPAGNGSLEIDCNIDEGKGLVIQITDQGVEFNPLSSPDPDVDAPIEEREIGGLGIYMMRNIMDEVHYKREGDRNILTLVKY